MIIGTCWKVLFSVLWKVRWKLKWWLHYLTLMFNLFTVLFLAVTPTSLLRSKKGGMRRDMELFEKYTKNTQSGCTGTHWCPRRTYFGSMYTLYSQTEYLFWYFLLKLIYACSWMRNICSYKKNSRTIPSGVKWYWVPRMDPFSSNINPVQLDWYLHKIGPNWATGVFCTILETPK